MAEIQASGMSGAGPVDDGKPIFDRGKLFIPQKYEILSEEGFLEPVELLAKQGFDLLGQAVDQLETLAKVADRHAVQDLKKRQKTLEKLMNAKPRDSVLLKDPSKFTVWLQRVNGALEDVSRDFSQLNTPAAKKTVRGAEQFGVNFKRVILGKSDSGFTELTRGYDHLTRVVKLQFMQLAKLKSSGLVNIDKPLKRVAELAKQLAKPQVARADGYASPEVGRTLMKVRGELERSQQQIDQLTSQTSLINDRLQFIDRTFDGFLFTSKQNVPSEGIRRGAFRNELEGAQKEFQRLRNDFTKTSDPKKLDAFHIAVDKLMAKTKENLAKLSDAGTAWANFSAHLDKRQEQVMSLLPPDSPETAAVQKLVKDAKALAAKMNKSMNMPNADTAKLLKASDYLMEQANKKLFKMETAATQKLRKALAPEVQKYTARANDNIALLQRGLKACDDMIKGGFESEFADLKAAIKLAQNDLRDQLATIKTQSQDEPTYALLSRMRQETVSMEARIKVLEDKFKMDSGNDYGF